MKRFFLLLAALLCLTLAHAQKKQMARVNYIMEQMHFDRSGKLTDAQAEELMQSKFRKDAGELDIRRQYYARFKALVGAAKARRIIALSNDKLSKGGSSKDKE